MSENFEIYKPPIGPEKPKDSEEKFKNAIIEAVKKSFEQIQEIDKKSREVIPPDRNFVIELEETKKGVNLRLKHKESGKEKDLSTFLPPGHFFVKDEEFCYRPKEKKIGFPENELEFRGFLLELFHEIGHACQKQEHPLTAWDDLKALLEVLYKLIKSGILNKIGQKSAQGKKIIFSLRRSLEETLLPQWYLDKIYHGKAKSERGAWAYALRSLRKLEQDGYNVFAGFENVDQIRAYVTCCLYNYDLGVAIDKLMSGDWEGLEKLRGQPPFSKKVTLLSETKKESVEDKS